MTNHIDTSHLQRFVLGKDNLTEEEKGHLLDCARCMDAMTETTVRDLGTISADEHKL